MVRPQIVITGCGVVNPLGVNRDQFWDALRAGRSALRREDPAGAASVGDAGKLSALLRSGEAKAAAATGLWAARVGDFGAAAAIDANRRRRMPRLGQMAIVAAQQALGVARDPAVATPDSALVLSFYGADRVGVALGTALGALDLTVEFMTQYLSAGLAAGSPASFPYTVLNTPAALIAMELGLRGPNVTVNHRDLSAAEALATACDLLACGRADAILAGGADELSQSLLHAYRRFACLATPGEPGDAASAAADGRSLPYDRRRHGLCPGEGATLFLLERADAAERRGARVLARVAGYGRGGDARSRVGWSAPQGVGAAALDGAQAAIHTALRSAGCRAEQVDCVVGSGNGTDLDPLESTLLRQTLAAAADRVAVVSLLGQSGEWPTSAAARLGQALFTLHEQALPRCPCPHPDAQAALPGLCVQRDSPEPIPAAVEHILVPCVAQGGGSVALMLARG